MKYFHVRVLFIGIIFLLVSLPLIQMKYDLFKKSNLNGVVVKAERPMISLETIQTGEFQKKFEEWFNQNFGLRDFYVKTNNQLFYSVFDQTPPNSRIVVGKNKQLYEINYIKEYLNFIPPLSAELLEQKVIEIKKMQNLLEKRGKHFLLWITPSKAAIYPEYIPDQLKNLQVNRPRNYDIIIPLLEKYGVNYIDGHKITIEHKKSDKYDMFPEGGTHWNYLAAYYTSKATIEKLEDITGRDLTNIEMSGTEYSPPIGTDRDLADLLNVWKTPVDYLSPKPILEKKQTGQEFKPSIFMEGGSFSEQFINTLQQVNAFKQFDLYYYYYTHTQYKEGAAGGNFLGEISKVNWDEVFNHDIIMLEMNEENIPKLQSGFLQDAISQLDPIKLNFSYINKDYTERITVGGSEGFLLKKGAPGSETLYMESDKLTLIPGKEYTLTYKAKGFKYLNVDLFPDELPQQNNTNITDEPQEFSFTFKSDSQKMKEATLRFFIDNLDQKTDKDTYIYDIKLTNKTK